MRHLFTDKPKRGRQSAEYTRSAFRWDADNHRLLVAGLGALRVRWSRKIANPSTVTITKDEAGRYFVSLCVDEPEQTLPSTGASVGIDLGVTTLATLSTGETIANPRHLAGKLSRLARLQRVLARRKKGSGRWQRQRQKVARQHARIGDSRKDHLEKVTTDLVRRFDVLAVEDLHVQGMLRNRTMARSLSDAGLGAFRRTLKPRLHATAAPYWWPDASSRLANAARPAGTSCPFCRWQSASGRARPAMKPTAATTTRPGTSWRGDTPSLRVEGVSDAWRLRPPGAVPDET